MALRVVRLSEEGRNSMGMNSLLKAAATRNTQQVARLGREIMGGNGILLENFAMKALLDIESLVTGEGTNEMMDLLVGRELTGISAFTVPKPKF